MHSCAAVTGRSHIKVGVAKGYVGLSLFKQCLVVHNSAIGKRLTRRAAEMSWNLSAE